MLLLVLLIVGHRSTIYDGLNSCPQATNSLISKWQVSWSFTGDGYSFADGPNAGESAAAITRQINMLLCVCTTRAPAIPL